jgi:hypothetical protein
LHLISGYAIFFTIGIFIMGARMALSRQLRLSVTAEQKAQLDGILTVINFTKKATLDQLARLNKPKSQVNIHSIMDVVESELRSTNKAFANTPRELTRPVINEMATLHYQFPLTDICSEEYQAKRSAREQAIRNNLNSSNISCERLQTVKVDGDKLHLPFLNTPWVSCDAPAEAHRTQKAVAVSKKLAQWNCVVTYN